MPWNTIPVDSAPIRRWMRRFGCGCFKPRPFWQSHASGPCDTPLWFTQTKKQSLCKCRETQSLCILLAFHCQMRSYFKPRPFMTKPHLWPTWHAPLDHTNKQRLCKCHKNNHWILLAVGLGVQTSFGCGWFKPRLFWQGHASGQYDTPLWFTQTSQCRETQSLWILLAFTVGWGDSSGATFHLKM